MKNDTNGRNGIVQVWVDDAIIINTSNWDFTLSGFSQIEVGHNGNSAVSSPNTAIGIRIDDIAVATPGYEGFVDDGRGNPRIGLLDESPPEAPPDPPTIISVDIM